MKNIISGNEIIMVGSLDPVRGLDNSRSRVMLGGGIGQTLRATDYKDPPKVLVEYKNGKTTQ